MSDLAPVMATLSVRRPLNMLNQALAVVLVAGAELRVAVGSDLLRDGAHDLGVDYLVLA